MHIGVVVFQLHLFYLLLHQWLQGLPEVGALGTGVCLRDVLSWPPCQAPATLPGGQSTAAHWVLAAQHEADLAAGVGGDGAVGVVHHWEERLAEVSHLLDEVQVQPLALAYGGGAGWSDDVSTS